MIDFTLLDFTTLTKTGYSVVWDNDMLYAYNWSTGHARMDYFNDEHFWVVK